MAKINKILANGNEYDSWATNADFISLSEFVAGQIANVMDRIGNPVKATEEEYTAFRAHLQDEIDELLTPIEEEESNE